MTNLLPQQFYYKKNRLQQLKGFYYTVQTGSPSRAAKVMGLNRSTLTLQIKSLERDLKTALFIKNKNRFQLTKDGQEFYDMAIPYLRGIDSLYERFVSDKKVRKARTVSIAMHHAAICHLLPKYLEEYNKKNSDIKISIHNIPRDEAIERLKREEIDFILYPIDTLPKDLWFRSAFKSDPVLLMRKDHPLAQKDDISLEEISRYKLVRIDPRLITLPLFRELIKVYNIGSNIKLENGNWEMLKYFVKANLCLAVVNDISVDKDDPILVTKSLSRYFPQMEYGVTIKRGRYLNDAVKEFINIIDPDFFDNYEDSMLYK